MSTTGTRDINVTPLIDVLLVLLVIFLSLSIDNGPRFPARELASQLRLRLGKAGAVFIDSVDAVPWGLVVSTVDTVRGVALDTSRDVKVAVRLREPD